MRQTSSEQAIATGTRETKPQQPRGRVNEGLLQPFERPALAWIAARLPAWITSDMLTCVGLFGAFLAFLGYALSSRHLGFLLLASAGIAINWFGDSLDGTLARFRRRERPRYGYFVDHTVDTFNELFIILGLGLTPFIRFEAACLILIAYLMVSVFVFVRANVTNELRISIALIGPTELRVLVLALNGFMLLAAPAPVLTLWAPLTVIDVAMLIGFGAAMIGLAVAIIIESRRIGREDPLRRE